MLPGRTNVKSLVFASAFIRVIPQQNGDYRNIAEESQVVALCAAQIAVMVVDVALEDARLGDLFHNAGVTLLAQGFNDWLEFMG